MKTNKIAALINKRQKTHKEIEDIQKECPHFSRSVKSIQERLDSTTMVIRWVCNDCYKIVGYPSNEEINKFVKK